jgi:UDP-glucose 4-epimerase
MRIAVTGGAGFIGKATVDRARGLGHEAWRFDRADGHDVLTDLSNLDGAECVIHLAGALGTSELFDFPEHAVDANIKGTLAILKWCARNDASFVGITMPDSDWANVYQATKLCSMKLATAWHRNFGVPVSHVRAFNAYGPGQKHGAGHPQKFLPTFASMAWRGEPIPIWGDGLQSVDAIHVDEVARMLVDATRFGNDEIFDAGTGVAVTVNRIASFVNRTCGQPDTNVVHYPMRLGETPQTHIRAKGAGWSLLDWRPTMNWERVKETVEWYKPTHLA